MTLPLRVRRRAELDVDDAYAWYDLEAPPSARERAALLALPVITFAVTMLALAMAGHTVLSESFGPLP